VTSLTDITIRSYPHTVRTMGIFGLLWCGVLAIPLSLQDPKVVAFYSLNIAVVSAVTGISLRARLSSPRAQTIPDYRVVHIAIALGWCALTPILSAGISVFRGIPLMPLLLWLWSFSLLVLISGYALPAVVTGMAVGGAPVAFFAFGSIYNQFTARMGWGAQLLLFIFNAAATVLLVRRMSQLNEEAFEYVLTDPREIKQAIYEKTPGPPNASLDSIHRVLPSDFRSRLRHLEMGLFPRRPSFLRFAVWMTAVFLVTRFFSPRAKDPFLLGWAIAFPMMSVFFARENVRRFLTLPVSRRELVAKGGGIILLTGLRAWCAIALAVAISEWGVPSPDFLLTSLAIQLPIFGLLTLALSVRTPWTNAQLLALIPAFLALVFVGILVTEETSLPVQIVVCLIGGAAVTGLSYYRWCNGEIE
jgi:hypothetical protein